MATTSGFAIVKHEVKYWNVGYGCVNGSVTYQRDCGDTGKKVFIPLGTLAECIVRVSTASPAMLSVANELNGLRNQTHLDYLKEYDLGRDELELCKPNLNSSKGMIENITPYDKVSVRVGADAPSIVIDGVEYKDGDTISYDALVKYLT